MTAVSRRVFPYVALAIMLAAFYGATYSYRDITDTDLNSMQTRALVLHGDVEVGRYHPARNAFAMPHDGDKYSIYGVGISLVAAPIYLVTVHLGIGDRVTQAVAAIPFVVGAIVLMYRLLLKIFGGPRAVAGTLIFAFGTTMWPLASMAFYTHGPVALLHMIGIATLFSPKERIEHWAGIAFGMATLVRPTVFPFAVAAGVFYAMRGLRPAVRYGLGALPAAAGMLVQNRWIWGSWTKSGYSVAGIGFHGNVPRDVFALLFGWWRGIFVYSPILLLAVAGFVLAARKRRGFVEHRLLVLGIASIATILFYARWTTWWGGLSQFGYRYLLDIVPALVLLSVYALPSVTRLQSIVVPAGIVSVMTMAAGSMPSKGAFDVVRFPRFGGTPIGQAWTVALDEPIGPLIRLAGIAVIAAILWRLTPRLYAHER